VGPAKCFERRCGIDVIGEVDLAASAVIPDAGPTTTSGAVGTTHISGNGSDNRQEFDVTPFGESGYRGEAAACQLGDDRAQ
jgi:hypothetical protein